MKLQWFSRKGIFYAPVSLIGWLILSVAAVYAVYLFIDLNGRSHSVSDLMINWVFNLLIIGVVYTLIGSLTEKRAISAKPGE